MHRGGDGSLIGYIAMNRARRPRNVPTRYLHVLSLKQRGAGGSDS